MRILVAGAGAMGTATAGILSEKNEVELWGRREKQTEALAETRENTAYLPGYKIPENVKITIGGKPDISSCDLVVLGIPTQFLRSMADELGLLSYGGPVVSMAKGLELSSFLTPCQILEDLGMEPGLLMSLSGPSHAEEMAKGVPTSVVLAGNDMELLRRVTPNLSGSFFRPYYSGDRLGVELGGALKNVIAIAAGISDGLGFGMNTVSALITRGLAEIRKYGVAKGAQAETFYGLSCLGDLVTTCCSPFSRNRAFGESLVRGGFDLSAKLAEGAYTAKSLAQELPSLDFEMPLCMAVYQIAHEGVNPPDALAALLNRPIKEED